MFESEFQIGNSGYKPFSSQEISELTRKGKEIAKDWGELRGPVDWEA